MAQPRGAIQHLVGQISQPGRQPGQPVDQLGGALASQIKQKGEEEAAEEETAEAAAAEA